MMARVMGILSVRNILFAWNLSCALLVGIYLNQQVYFAIAPMCLGWIVTFIMFVDSTKEAK